MLGKGSGRSNDLPGPRICAPAPGCEKRKLQHDSEENAQPAALVAFCFGVIVGRANFDLLYLKYPLAYCDT